MKKKFLLMMTAVLLLSGCANENSKTSNLFRPNYEREMTKNSDYSKVCRRLKKLGWKVTTAFYTYELNFEKNGSGYYAEVSPAWKFIDFHEEPRTYLEYARKHSDYKTLKGKDCKVYFYKEKDEYDSSKYCIASNYANAEVRDSTDDADENTKKEFAMSLTDLAGRRLTNSGFNKRLKKLNTDCTENISFGLQKGKYYITGAYTVKNMQTEKDAIEEKKNILRKFGTSDQVYPVSKKGRKGFMDKGTSYFQYIFKENRKLTLIVVRGGDKYETRKKLANLLAWG